MTAGASRAELTITRQPALAPSPQPRPAPTARALIAQSGERWGPSWMPIRGPDWAPIDKLIAAELGDVHEQQGWRVLRAQKIALAGRKSWCESNDPEFAAKAADVVGLYIAPPRNAIVLCVDEKPSIQALERAQGYLKLPNGRALTGHSHDYKRHGTSTLFAVFEVATGKVKAVHKKRRRRKEFLDFMDEVVADYPRSRLEVILDNLNTHKKNEEWLARHPKVK